MLANLPSIVPEDLPMPAEVTTISGQEEDVPVKLPSRSPEEEDMPVPLEVDVNTDVQASVMGLQSATFPTQFEKKRKT